MKPKQEEDTTFFPTDSYGYLQFTKDYIWYSVFG